MASKKREYNAKEELEKIHLYEERAEFVRTEIAMIDTETTKTTTTLSADVVSGTRRHDRLERNIARKVDLEKDLEEYESILDDQRAWLRSLICKLQKAVYVKVLRKRYFENQSLKEIAVDLGRSYRNTCDIHGKALQAMAELMNEMEE